MKTIAFINLKGGVGKTTSAANIAGELQNEGFEVLVGDCDKQGNLTKLYGVNVLIAHKGMASVLTGEVNTRRAIIQRDLDYPYDTDIIPADINLLAANQTLERPDALAEAFRELEDIYDFLILDCPPNIDMITLNVLACADEVIIPVRLDGFAESGIEDILEQVEQIRAINPKITFRGCLITQYKRSVKAFDQQLALREKYKCFKTVIPYTEKVPESTVAQKMLAEYSPTCGAARAYHKFMLEYLEG